MTLLAEPGGICVSRSVFEQIENKVPRKLIQLSESELGDTLPGGEVFKVGELHPQVLQAAAASRKQLGWLVMGVVGLNLLLFLLFGLNRKADQVTPLNGRIVEAACGECQFKMPGKGCDLAVRIDGKSYFVDGFHMDQLGDAHAADGMCNAIRQARVTGQFKDGRFVASAFELLPAK
jgi:hypothetical protein